MFSDRQVGMRHVVTQHQESENLRDAYTRLIRHYGKQRWWPKNLVGDRRDPSPTVDEIAIGAVLVQRTSWRNVELALQSLADARIENLQQVEQLAETELAQIIRHAGPPRVKASRLLALARFARKKGGLESFLDGVRDKRVALERREELLEVHGIGPETADCLLLYGGGAPLAVVDAFLRRVLRRHAWLDADASYEELQQRLGEIFGEDAHLHNEMHALIVRLGGDRCKARNPLCDGCVLEPLLPDTGRCRD